MAEDQADDSIKMTMQSTINGAATFNTVAGPAKVTNAAWVKMVGAFTPSSIATALLLYIEGASATSSYYVDGFSIGLSNGGCTNPPDNSGFSSGFESGTSEGWVSRGGGSPVVLTPTMADAHTGSWSLLVAGRTARDSAKEPCGASRG